MRIINCRNAWITPDALTISAIVTCFHDLVLPFSLYTTTGNIIGEITINYLFLQEVAHGEYEDYDGDEQFIDLPPDTYITLSDDFFPLDLGDNYSILLGTDIGVVNIFF
jgi:hypothetical protein